MLFGKNTKLVFPQVTEVCDYLQLLPGDPNGRIAEQNHWNQFKVFFMLIKKANLLAYDAAQAVATRLDFILPPKKLSVVRSIAGTPRTRSPRL